jgi:trimeric autotransporter adhesin
MRTYRPVLRPGDLAFGLILLLGTPAGAQSNILLQLESGSPAGDRFVVDSAGGFVARGTLGRGTILATGAGVRLMWYPRKAAFRAGFADGTQWNDGSIGYYSTAMGQNTTATAYHSTAMGSSTMASGASSTAIGSGSTASGSVSTAMGNGTMASGDYSIAMGYSTTASGNYSTAMGYSTTASGSSSTAMGGNTTASGLYSTAMGSRTTASAGYSTAMGSWTLASGTNSTAMGRRASTHGHSGSFVYGDVAGSSGDTVRASVPNEATWRTTGGFRIFTNTGLTTGCNLPPAGINWVCTSSRLEKENFAEVDGEDVLRRLRAVPVTSWNGIAEGPRVRHIGPMAQDWHVAFALNDDPLTIHQGDLAGVSLAAVQALDGRTRGVPEMEERIRALEAENSALRADASEQRARLERLEALLVGLVPEP